MNIISSFFSLPLSLPLPLSVFCILLNSHNCQFLESNVIFSFSYVGTFSGDFTTSVDTFKAEGHSWQWENIEGFWVSPYPPPEIASSSNFTGMKIVQQIYLSIEANYGNSSKGLVVI